MTDTPDIPDMTTMPDMADLPDMATIPDVVEMPGISDGVYYKFSKIKKVRAFRYDGTKSFPEWMENRSDWKWTTETVFMICTSARLEHVLSGDWVILDETNCIKRCSHDKFVKKYAIALQLDRK